MYDEEYFGLKQPQLVDFQSYDEEPWYFEAIKELGVVEGKAVLDIGCGAGKAMQLIKGASVIGIDIARFAVNIASQFGASLVASAAALPFKDDTFEGVLMVDIVEHLLDQELLRALKEAHRVLKKGGRIVVHTQPNGLFGRPFYFFNRRRLRETGHINALPPWKLKSLLEKSYFPIQRFYVKDFILVRRLEKSFKSETFKQFLGNRIIAVGQK